MSEWPRAFRSRESVSSNGLLYRQPIISTSKVKGEFLYWNKRMDTLKQDGNLVVTLFSLPFQWVPE